MQHYGVRFFITHEVDWKFWKFRPKKQCHAQNSATRTTVYLVVLSASFTSKDFSKWENSVYMNSEEIVLSDSESENMTFVITILKVRFTRFDHACLV